MHGDSDYLPDYATSECPLFESELDQASLAELFITEHTKSESS